MSNPAQGAVGADTMTAGSKAVSARTLAGILRSRIERAAEHKSETVSLGQFFADQIHRYLTEAGHGPEHDARSGDVPADGGDPDCDRGRDWGLRARQVHLEALSKRAAGGKWFASTNGADGLARLDNGTDGMFPVRGEWHEIEFIEALVNAYRNGDLTSPRADSDERTAGETLKEACKPWEHYTGEPPDDGSPLSGVFVAGMVYTERLLAKLLDVTHYEGGDGSEDFDSDATQTLRNILTGARLWDADENRPISATPAQPAGAVPDSLRALSEAATQGPWAATYQEYDDWGVIRTTVERENGFRPVVCAARVLDDEREQAAARRENRQPRICGANASLIVAAVNRLREEIASHPAGQGAGSGAEDEAVWPEQYGRLADGYGPIEEWRDWLKQANREPLSVGAIHALRGMVGEFTSDAVKDALQTAPDSTRTGQGEERLRKAVSKALHDNQFLDGWPEMVDPVVNAVLAARPAAPEAQGTWLPINTAPKDGTRIDLWVVPHDAFANGNADRLEARWMEHVGWVRIGGGYVSECGEPTHWQPLPAPAASSGQGGR